MKKATWKNPVMLLLTAAIWGSAFVAQSVGMEYVQCFTFNCVRSLIGGLVLIPCISFLDWMKGKELRVASDEKAGEAEGGRGKQRQEVKAEADSDGNVKWRDKTLLAGGISCGVILFLASNMQQLGIQYTTVGKAGFITALYIVIVPVLGIFLRRKCGIQVWVSVLIALAGFYLLSIREDFRPEKADCYLLISALLFSVHILVIDYFSVKTDCVKMSCIQFFVCGILSGVVMAAAEQPSWERILDAKLPILYAGVLSCGVAYTLQIVGQKNYNPTIASLILSLESVFSVLAGWVILRQVLSARELWGCFMIFCAVVLAQIPIRRRRRGEG